jgi:hypothetical protein
MRLSQENLRNLENLRDTSTYKLYLLETNKQYKKVNISSKPAIPTFNEMEAGRTMKRS